MISNAYLSLYGITSTTVLVSALRDQGAEVDYVIPNRFIHGYGPNEQLFREAYADGVSLLITVDNGIAGVQEVKVAKELGLKVIITDHHEPGEALPDADVILHPRIPEGHYPFGELAGVGVSFKFNFLRKLLSLFRLPTFVIRCLYFEITSSSFA